MVFIVKLIGSVLILISGFLIGNKIKKQYQTRRNILKQFQESLKYADDAIVIENMLLEDVMRKCSNKFFPLEKGNDLWNIAADKLKENYGSFEGAWTKACDVYFEEMSFLNELDCDCIKDIGKALGIASVQRQSLHIQNVIKRLSELENEALKIQASEGKHAVQIAMAVAAAIIIILF